MRSQAGKRYKLISLYSVIKLPKHSVVKLSRCCCMCVNFNHLIGRCCTKQLCPKSPWVYSPA
jgi:hypothetical protein